MELVRLWKEKVVMFLLKAVVVVVLEENLGAVETEAVLGKGKGYRVARLVVVVNLGEVYLMVVEGNLLEGYVMVVRAKY